jgi:hypothetical protein
MRLADLNPVFTRGSGGKAYLAIACPLCGDHPDGHRFTIPLFEGGPLGAGSAKRWGYSGSPPDWDTVSVMPSVELLERCRAHFTISNGHIQ